MKPNLLFFRSLGVAALALLTGSQLAQAQGPTIDPTFQPTSVYRSAQVTHAVQLADGKLVVAGSITRAGGLAAGGVVRFSAANQPDTAFIANTRGLKGYVNQLVELPNSKLLLRSNDSLKLGSVSRRYLLRLNADGTPDASFEATFSPFYGSPPVNVTPQPDGKLLLVSYTGSGSIQPPLTRLLVDGSVDQLFQLNTTLGSLPNGTTIGSNVVLQSDGKIVVPGGPGNTAARRLLPSGALDPTFSAPPLALGELGHQVALQPDGRVLLSILGNFPSPARLVRLLPTGAADPSFQAVGPFSLSSFSFFQRLLVQPNGAVLVNNTGGTLVRLLPTGAFDASFDASAFGTSIAWGAVQLLPSGQLLVSGSRLLKGGPAVGVDRLDATGARDPGFTLPLFQPGYVNDVVQLPGGGYLVGGNFTEINGLPLAHLVRMSALGVPSATFPATNGPDGEVSSLLVQPDGKVLVSGYFERIAGSSRTTLVRLLATGALDAAFAPPFLPVAPDDYGNQYGYYRQRLARLPDGRVLLTGQTRLVATGPPDTQLRLLDATTGQPDAAFPIYHAMDVLSQPDGKVIIGGIFIPGGSRFGAGTATLRLLPTGAPDPSFTGLRSGNSGFGGGPFVNSLTQDAAGQIFGVTHSTTDTSPGRFGGLVSLQADGTVIQQVQDARFLTTKALAAQPNGRLLIGADLSSTTPTFGLTRLLPTFVPDGTFLGANAPANTVLRLLVQPDGAIVAAGSFASVGSQPISGLVRLLDPNVLHVAAAAAGPRTEAWPVPAHQTLHLALEASSQPRRVELLDNLGRIVFTQEVIQAKLSLDTSALAAGGYLLRVQYASGPVVRRMVLN